MRHRAACCLAIALAAFAEAAAANCDSLASLDWLLGEWLADGRKSTFRESWTALGPTTWVGRGVETPKEDPGPASSEDLRLVEMGGGFHVAKVSHNELPVAFHLRECEGGRWVFENAAHDFPRRLEYVRGPDDRLQVRGSRGTRWACGPGSRATSSMCTRPGRWRTASSSWVPSPRVAGATSKWSPWNGG